MDFMEPIPEMPQNYSGENMLIGANNLNRDIKRFIQNNYGRYGSPAEDIEVLEDYKLDIEEYLRDIEAYNFAPRTDRLTKEGILIDLRTNLQKINELIEEINQRVTSGGRKRKMKSRKMKSRHRYRTHRHRTRRHRTRRHRRRHHKIRK